jgi:hypothetical protein
VAAWRRRALALFPELRGELNPANWWRFYGYNNYYLLFFDLFAMFHEALNVSDEQTLRRIFDFAEWCFCQGRRAPDLNNAVCVCFYEHVFDVAHRDWADVARWLSPAVIGACSTLWEARYDKDELEKLRAVLTAARRMPSRSVDGASGTRSGFNPMDRTV